MTVSSSRARVIHVASTGAVNYAFPFKAFKTGEIKVSLVNAAGISLALILGTDYSVGGLGQDSGGTVTLTASGTGKIKSGHKLVVQRQMGFVQEVDYRPHDSFPAETHERALDILTMQCQELREILSRAILAPEDVTKPITYAEIKNIVAQAMDWAKVAEEQVGKAIKAAQDAAASAAIAAKVQQDFYKLSIAVDDAPYGHVASGSYNAATNMLTLRVPEGLQGKTGIQGAQGATGAQGPAGPMGVPGIDGKQGPTGPMGPTGPAGATGAQGYTGPMGAPGIDGKVGPAGPPGTAPYADVVDCGGAYETQLTTIDGGLALF